MSIITKEQWEECIKKAHSENSKPISSKKVDEWEKWKEWYSSLSKDEKHKLLEDFIAEHPYME